MNTSKKIAEISDRKVVLPTLWILMIFNYLYWDLTPMIFDATGRQVATTTPEGPMLGFAVFSESAVAMVLLSRVLTYGANRWANIIAGILHAATISWVMLRGLPLPVYVFFASIVVASALFIVWYAWTWPNPDARVGVGTQSGSS
jgi:hypothetical protein